MDFIVIVFISGIVIFCMMYVINISISNRD